MATPPVPAEHNLAALHEAIAAAIPDRDSIVWRTRHHSWAEFTDRTRRFALEPFVGHRGRVCRLLEASGLRAPRHGPLKRIQPVAGR